MEQILQQFCFEGKPISCKPFGTGHINRTFRVTCDGGKEYTLQRINQVAFRNPEQLIGNIDAVTHYIAGISGTQKTLRLVPAKDGKKFCYDESGEFWRAYEFISGGVCL